MRLIRKLLKSFGFQVLKAIDDFTTLKILETETPDLVLLDINLPSIDSLEVLRCLRQSQEFAYIPVDALTANYQHGDRDRCLAAGCNGYLAKPIARRELYETLMDFLEGEYA